MSCHQMFKARNRSTCITHTLDIVELFARSFKYSYMYQQMRNVSKIKQSEESIYKVKRTAVAKRFTVYIYEVADIGLAIPT